MTQTDLLDRARTHLESNGFPMADLDMYFPKECDWDYGGITLRSNSKDGVTIYAIDPLCAHTSSEIVLTQKQNALLEPILDALMFLIKHGKSVKV
jgi:hypothetical protein